MRRVPLIDTDCVSPTPACAAFLDGFGSTTRDLLPPVVGTNGPALSTGRSFRLRLQLQTALKSQVSGSFLPLDAIEDDGMPSLASALADEDLTILFRPSRAVAEPVTLVDLMTMQGGLALAYRSHVGCRGLDQPANAIVQPSRALAPRVSDLI